ncbi:MAG: hypothetical protein HY598_04980 [Candidatus Omnitrophica bacterium]|nr:hypothetical protein [Candidatus Omnitrophota bacterium]
MVFVTETVHAMTWASLIMVPVAWLLGGPKAAIGVAGGMLWSLANVGALALLARIMMGTPRLSWPAHLGLWIVKIPLLYILGGVLAVSPWSSPVGFLVGFSLWFVLLMIIAARRVAA